MDDLLTEKNDDGGSFNNINDTLLPNKVDKSFIFYYHIINLL